MLVLSNPLRLHKEDIWVESGGLWVSHNKMRFIFDGDVVLTECLHELCISILNAFKVLLHVLKPIIIDFHWVVSISVGLSSVLIRRWQHSGR